MRRRSASSPGPSPARPNPHPSGTSTSPTSPPSAGSRSPPQGRPCVCLGPKSGPRPHAGINPVVRVCLRVSPSPYSWPGVSSPPGNRGCPACPWGVRKIDPLQSTDRSTSDPHLSRPKHPPGPSILVGLSNVLLRYHPRAVSGLPRVQRVRVRLRQGCRTTESGLSEVVERAGDPDESAVGPVQVVPVRLCEWDEEL